MPRLPPKRIDVNVIPDYKALLPKRKKVKQSSPHNSFWLYTECFRWESPLRSRTASLLNFELEDDDDPHVGAMSYFDTREMKKIRASEGYNTFVPLNDKEMKIIYGIDVKKEEYEGLSVDERQGYFDRAFEELKKIQIEARYTVEEPPVWREVVWDQSKRGEANVEDNPPIGPKEDGMYPDELMIMMSNFELKAEGALRDFRSFVGEE